MLLSTVAASTAADNPATSPVSSATSNDRWAKMADADRDRRREMVLAQIAGILREQWDALMPMACDRKTDLEMIEVASQAILRVVGGRWIEGVVQERVLATEGPAPMCPNCQHAMERQQRSREFEGLCGHSGIRRSCYRCRHCHVNVVPVDDQLGLGRGDLSPALSRVVAMHAAEDPFELSARSVNETLGINLSCDQLYTTAEALGSADEADIMAAQEAPPAEPGPLPEGSEILVIGADGTTSYMDKGYHEIKVGVVGPLGTEAKVDPKTGRKLLVFTAKDYCATAGSADAFFPRLELLARAAGWGHANLRYLINIGDGSEWLWNRFPRFDLPGLERVEIVDYIHVSGHIWSLAQTLFGAESAVDIHAWAEPLCIALMEQGPAPVLAALEVACAETAEAQNALRRTTTYIAEHAAAGRLDYPTFMVRGWPIASGVVEASCKSVVCQRTKASGMRWRRLGAQAILNLRCKLLSGKRWSEFFATRPCLRRPAVAMLRKEAHGAPAWAA